MSNDHIKDLIKHATSVEFLNDLRMFLKMDIDNVNKLQEKETDDVLKMMNEKSIDLFNELDKLAKERLAELKPE